MNKFFLIIPLLLTLSDSIASPADKIHQLIKQNLEANQSENIDRVMLTIHPQSPAYQSTRTEVQQVFPQYDLSYKLLEYKFIAVDGEYAYARMKQRTQKRFGPVFKDNEIEALRVFRKDKGQWKIWTQANLQINYLN